jgi:tetratricopeptide (TPR) repeat protein
VCREPIEAWWAVHTLAAARAATDDPHVLNVRLASATRTSPSLWTPRLESHTDRLSLAAKLQERSAYLDHDDSIRALAVGAIVTNDCRRAAAALATLQHRTVADSNDLAAAEACAADADQASEQWLQALVDVDETLERAPAMREARFNRAAIIDRMGVAPVARKAWEEYRRAEGESAWSRFAFDRAVALRRSTMDRWRAVAADPLRVDERDLTMLARRSRGLARRFAEGIFLPAWAAAMHRRDMAAAAKCRTAVEVIGRGALAAGDPALIETVHVIDASLRNPSRLRDTVAALEAWFRGRVLLRDGHPRAAAAQLKRARSAFAAAGAPMALLADFWIAAAATDAQRFGDAERMLARLIPATAAKHYQAWYAQSEYQAGLLAAMRGEWSASLAHAQRARDVFVALDDTGSTANADALLSEDFDLLGQEAKSVVHGLDAVRGSAADGAFDRTRVALATLCRTELRAARWERARSLAQLERELAPFAPEVRLDPDMFLRIAVANWHLGRTAAAMRALALARTAATRATDPRTRAKLTADVDGAEGTLLTRSEPRRAVALLSAAIAFEKSAARPIVLPELYLARGRAENQSGASDAAAADFEAGVVELERERRHVLEAQLRPGIFDDAADLFDEAILLELRSGAAPDRILQWIERGRARTLREQMGEGGAPVAVVSRIADVQRALAADSALIELASLPDRLFAIVIRRNTFALRTLPADRESLTRAARHAVETGTLDIPLLDVLRSDVEGVKSLTFVTDSALQGLPLAALPIGTPARPAIEQYVIAVCPSASIFVSSVHRQTTAGRAPPHDAVIFADPMVPADEYGDLAPLDAAETEAAHIASMYRQADLLVGPAATSRAFRDLAPRRAIVQFSGHAVANQREPWNSAIVCAASPGALGGLTSGEIARMRFTSTQTVVLAACSTMTGRNARVEGVPSLARAFIAAGVPEVIGTLWDIDDREAALVTIRLHQQLAMGVPAAEALRFAQLHAIRTGVPRSVWAAFAVTNAAGAAEPRAH